MFCPRCGTQMNDENICPGCGYDKTAKKSPDLPEFINRKNFEYLTAVAGALPLPLIIIYLVFGIFWAIPLIGVIFKIIAVVLSIVVILAELAVCAGMVYIIVKENDMRSPSGYCAAGTALISLISVIITAAASGGNAVSVIMSLITLITAADMLSRVFFLNLGLVSDVNFSRDFKVYKDMIDRSRQEAAERKQVQAQAQEEKRMYASYFDGSGIELLGYTILAGLLGAVTFTIATPWTTCMVLKWRKSHTVINGRRLTFTGTGGQMFLLWLKWFFLSLITFGIYAFFAYVDYMKWEAKHTFFDDEHPASGAVNRNSVFDGNTAEYFGYSIVAGLLSLVTLGIGFPWGYTMLMDWEMKHFVISGYRMSFDGKGIQYLGTCIICILLCLVTFGIYSPWATVRLNKWKYSHTNVFVPANDQPAVYQ